MLEKVVIIVLVENGLIPSELWTLALKTYFAEPAKNCEQRSFAPGNLSSFLRLP